MNANKKFLFGCGVFVVCAIVGFLLTRFAQDRIDGNESDKPDTTIIDPVDPEVNVDSLEQQPVKIESMVKKTSNNVYSLQISCSNVPDDAVLVYEIPDLQKKNSDGYFTQIPGRKSGSYKVIVKNHATNEVLASKDVSGFKLIEEKPVETMSAGEFQALLLNQNDNSLLGGKNPKVAKSIAFSFEGLNDGDKRPGDILSVREKIAYGIWSSARVLRVGYDEKGRINSVKIQPVYKKFNEDE